MRLILVGNYGVGNMGDEALREYFLRRFPNVSWTVLCIHPVAHSRIPELPRLPGGIRSLLGTSWGATLRAIRSSDGMVFGGGSLFTDVESSYACFLWWLHAAVAIAYRKPVYLAFQGIGPFRTKHGQWFTRWVVRRARYVSVRDAHSKQRIDVWNLGTKVVQSFDPVFLLIEKEKIANSSKKLLMIIPRHNSGNSLMQAAKKITKEQTFDEMTICCLHIEHPQERVFAKQLQDTLSLPSSIVSVDNMSELVDAMRHAHIVVTERYHGALAARALGIPLEIVSQGEGDKLAELRNNAASIDILMAQAQLGEDTLRQAFKN
jgi:polysaccharide pyruvyl transferase CsaB